MGKIIWICALMVAVFVVFTDFIDRDGNCLTWSELWDTTSIYREPLYVLLMLPRIVNNIAVCQLGNIFQLKTSHLIAITAPVTGALFGGLIGVILSKSKPATRWIVVCGILGSFLGMYNGILGMVGECRISEPITEYYKSVVQGLFWTLPVGFLFLPIAISYPIFCKYHGLVWMELVSSTILIGAVMGIATGFFIVNISRIARWTIYQVKKHGPTLSILAIVIIALVITAKIVPDLISMNNDDIQKINVEIDAGSVIRVGNEVLVRVMVTNEGVRHYANITTISFVDIKSKTIESDRIDVNLKPIGKEISQSKIIFDYSMYGDLVRSAEGGTLVRTYNINLSKIKPTLEYGDNITFIVITEYKIDNKTYNVSKPHTVTFLEPLQSQLDRLERLSRGYQDETDEKIKIDNKCKQLVDTNSSEIIKEIMSTEAFHNRTAEEVYQYCKLITTRPPMPPEVNITALKIRQELENRGQSEEQ